MSVVLVCGGRSFNDRDTVWSALDAVRPRTVVHGGANGADRLAGAWADENGVLCVVVPALWRAHGTAAGPIRNRRMLKVGQQLAGESDFGVMAFPGGRGTSDMVAIAEAADVAVVRIGVSPCAL